MTIMQDFNLTDTNVLITGASSGLGRAMSIACSEAGANVALVGRNKEALEHTRSLLTPNNHHCFSYDVTESALYTELFNSIESQMGKLSGFVHSAGIEKSLPLKAGSAKHYEQIFDVNTTAALELSRFVLKKKYRAESVSIIFMSSIMAVVGAPTQMAYAASKGALVSAARCAALEYANKGARFNCISPGFVAGTPMSEELLEKLPPAAKEDLISSYPLGLGETTDISNAAIFLLSRASRWITGTNIMVDGGYSAR
ncbi:NAD(P)-dependent dehydrogenase (short-subunit alcohol dehydrogenase family) [Litorimonas taeanensis]|uniref:NAD(P)-dependent dehydrogenase (Short-subunit alcohol dehydrogenase family) n=1 Tax=Litorimonas taeanensis TaxID=568099 RepID=A0A420WMD7_9PROT|nr:SDR family oxidoreductase [Litorimonas taeanensis]RKQ72208.1 NAD(P)-dependent dehydrogenase (short-subunit alcohol dehydrogenase family) [Litorimonas taeanensis]